jgi:hypothetical protein
MIYTEFSHNTIVSTYNWVSVLIHSIADEEEILSSPVFKNVDLVQRYNQRKDCVKIEDIITDSTLRYTWMEDLPQKEILVKCEEFLVRYASENPSKNVYNEFIIMYFLFTPLAKVNNLFLFLQMIATDKIMKGMYRMRGHPIMQVIVAAKAYTPNTHDHTVALYGDLINPREHASHATQVHLPYIMYYYISSLYARKQIKTTIIAKILAGFPAMQMITPYYDWRANYENLLKYLDTENCGNISKFYTSILNTQTFPVLDRMVVYFNYGTCDRDMIGSLQITQLNTYKVGHSQEMNNEQARIYSVYTFDGITEPLTLKILTVEKYFLVGTGETSTVSTSYMFELLTDVIYCNTSEVGVNTVGIWGYTQCSLTSINVISHVRINRLLNTFMSYTNCVNTRLAATVAFFVILPVKFPYTMLSKIIRENLYIHEQGMNTPWINWYSVFSTSYPDLKNITLDSLDGILAYALYSIHPDDILYAVTMLSPYFEHGTKLLYGQDLGKHDVSADDERVDQLMKEFEIRCKNVYQVDLAKWIAHKLTAILNAASSHNQASEPILTYSLAKCLLSHASIFYKQANGTITIKYENFIDSVYNVAKCTARKAYSGDVDEIIEKVKYEYLVFIARAIDTNYITSLVEKYPLFKVDSDRLSRTHISDYPDDSALEYPIVSETSYDLFATGIYSVMPPNVNIKYRDQPVPLNVMVQNVPVTAPPLQNEFHVQPVADAPPPIQRIPLVEYAPGEDPIYILINGKLTDPNSAEVYDMYLADPELLTDIQDAVAEERSCRIADEAEKAERRRTENEPTKYDNSQPLIPVKNTEAANMPLQHMDVHNDNPLLRRKIAMYVPEIKNNIIFEGGNYTMEIPNAYTLKFTYDAIFQHFAGYLGLVIYKYAADKYYAQNDLFTNYTNAQLKSFILNVHDTPNSPTECDMDYNALKAHMGVVFIPHQIREDIQARMVKLFKGTTTEESVEVSSILYRKLDLSSAMTQRACIEVGLVYYFYIHVVLNGYFQTVVGQIPESYMLLNHLYKYYTAHDLNVSYIGALQAYYTECTPVFLDIIKNNRIQESKLRDIMEESYNTPGYMCSVFNLSQSVDILRHFISQHHTSNHVIAELQFDFDEIIRATHDIMFASNPNNIITIDTGLLDEANESNLFPLLLPEYSEENTQFRIDTLTAMNKNVLYTARTKYTFAVVFTLSLYTDIIAGLAKYYETINPNYKNSGAGAPKHNEMYEYINFLRNTTFKGENLCDSAIFNGRLVMKLSILHYILSFYRTIDNFNSQINVQNSYPYMRQLYILYSISEDFKAVITGK